MRGFEMVRKLFYDLAKEKGQNPVLVNFQTMDFLVIFLQEDDAIVAFTQEQLGSGKKSHMKVWNISFTDDVLINGISKDLLIDIPSFQISAEPFGQNEHCPELGQKIQENISVRFNSNRFNGFFESLLESRFLIFVSHLMETAIIMQKDEQPIKPIYWERALKLPEYQNA